MELTSLELNKDLKLFQHGKTLMGVNQKSLKWMVLPITSAPNLFSLLGKPIAEVRNLANNDKIVRQILDAMDGADGFVPFVRTRDQESKFPIVTQQPEIRVLKLVSGCNMACSYCYDEASSHIERMPIDRIATTIEFMLARSRSGWVHIHFHGGEPLLHWDGIVAGVSAANEKAKEYDAHVTFALGTNGVLLTDEKLDWLIDNNVAIRLSYDGMGNLTDSVRRDLGGGGTSKRVLSKIDMLLKRSSYKDWIVLTTVNAHNIQALADIVLQMEDMGVPSIQFQPIRGQGFATNRKDLGISGQDYATTLLAIARLIEQGRVKQIRVQALLNSLLPLITGHGLQSSCSGGRCGAGNDVMAIDPDGTIGACDTLPKGKLRTLGHVDRGIEVDFTATSILADVANNSDCKVCPWLHVCKGGCPGAALSEQGSYFEPHEFGCYQTKHLNPELLLSLATGPELYNYFVAHQRKATAEPQW